MGCADCCRASSRACAGDTLPQTQSPPTCIGSGERALHTLSDLGLQVFCPPPL